MIIRHDVAPELYLISPDQFPAVVTVASHTEEVLVSYDNIDRLLKPNLLPAVKTEPDFVVCTDGMGCLIHPNWILTAAHVAKDLPENHKIEIGGVSYAVQQVVLHPNYTESEEMTRVRGDIALIELSNEKNKSAQSLSEKITPLFLYSQKDETNKVATLVGSGDYGNGLIGPDSADGQWRKATNRIERVDAEWLILRFDTPPECTKLEGVSGPGDRGGPALVEVDGKWAIVGISSGQSSSENLGEGHYGVWEYYTRVSSYLDWIESVLL